MYQPLSHTLNSLNCSIYTMLVLCIENVIFPQKRNSSTLTSSVEVATPFKCVPPLRSVVWGSQDTRFRHYFHYSWSDSSRSPHLLNIRPYKAFSYSLNITEKRNTFDFYLQLFLFKNQICAHGS